LIKLPNTVTYRLFPKDKG